MHIHIYTQTHTHTHTHTHYTGAVSKADVTSHHNDRGTRAHSKQNPAPKIDSMTAKLAASISAAQQSARIQARYS